MFLKKTHESWVFKRHPPFDYNTQSSLRFLTVVKVESFEIYTQPLIHICNDFQNLDWFVTYLVVSTVRSW